MPGGSGEEAESGTARPPGICSHQGQEDPAWAWEMGTCPESQWWVNWPLNEKIVPRAGGGGQACRVAECPAVVPGGRYWDVFPSRQESGPTLPKDLDRPGPETCSADCGTNRTC